VYAPVRSSKKNFFLLKGAEGGGSRTPLCHYLRGTLCRHTCGQIFSTNPRPGKLNGRRDWKRWSRKPKPTPAQPKSKLGQAFTSEVRPRVMAKRETNAQRRARENKRRRILEIAKEIAGVIRTRREASSARQRELFEYFEKVFSSCFGDKSLQSESVENIAQSLRLAADLLEEKPMDGRSFTGHDGKIMAAFLEAIRRLWRDPRRVSLCYEDAIFRISTAQPTFAEFLEV